MRVWSVLGFALACGAAALVWRQTAGTVPGTVELAQQLEDLGRVAVIGGSDLFGLSASGATLVPASSIEGLASSLEGDSEEALIASLRAAHVQSLVIDGRARGAGADSMRILDRMTRYDAFDHLAAVYLTPSAALYQLRSNAEFEPRLATALGFVARSILNGAEPPAVASYPESLRRIRNVEIMVMLSEDGRPRLWRSARGASIARALGYAAGVARDRWNERHTAMGGPLSSQLRELDVEVFLLDEDGTLADRSPAFIERVFMSRHGVAYDKLGTWHYLLPEATGERGEGSAVRAYLALFQDNDMAEDSLSRDDVRLYRLLARSLAKSPAQGGEGSR